MFQALVLLHSCIPNWGLKLSRDDVHHWKLRVHSQILAESNIENEEVDAAAATNEHSVKK